MAAQDDDLAVIASDARLRGISLGRALGELVASRAEELRQHRRPRVGAVQIRIDVGHRRGAWTATPMPPAAQPFRSDLRESETMALVLDTGPIVAAMNRG